MNEAIEGTGIDITECPGCDAALEHNVALDWMSAPEGVSTPYTPDVRCPICDLSVNTAYGIDTSLDLLPTAGIDLKEATAGERVEPRTDQ